MFLLLACTDPPKPDPADSAGDTDETATYDSEPEDTDTTATVPTTLRINEVMSNNHSVEDPTGATPDWVELYNAGPDPVDLTGWTLDDGGDGLALTGILLGGDFVVIWADGSTEGFPYAPFEIASEGEGLTLSNGASTVTVDVPALDDDVSWGPEQVVEDTVLLGPGSTVRVGDGSGDWTSRTYDDSTWSDAVLPLGFDGTASGGDPVDAAFGATAAQSSSWPGFTADMAVDGDPASFSHTDTADMAPWLAVTFASEHTISALHLMNRSNCCPERLYNLTLSLQNAGATVWTSDVLNPVATDGTPTDPGQSFTFEVDPPVVADTVRADKVAVGGTYGSEWLSIADLVAIGTPSAPYADTIITEVEAPVYLRAALSLVRAPDRLVLDIGIDDSFEAWIDELSVASAAGEHDGDTVTRTVLDPRIATDATFALAADTVDPDDLLVNPTLTASWITDGEPAFFGTPTPGEANGTGYDGWLDAPLFDPPRGFYDGPTTVTITGGGTLVYTTDGSVPTLENGTIAVGSATVELATTGILRAAQFADGYAPSEVATHSYLFLADVIRQPVAPAGWPTTWDGVSEAPVSGDYEMDPQVVDLDPTALIDALRSIPTLSIVTGPDALFGPEGLYENSAERGDEWERGVSVELLLEDGSTGFQEDCGIRVHGYGWRPHSSTKKHSFRLEFSREYGESKLEYPLFADSSVTRFDSIVLRAGGSKTWLDFRDPANAQYLHDAFARDTARDMGKLDGHATYVHLYLNGLYWGLYNPVERPESDFGSEYLGGDADEYDAINRRTSTNEAVDGTLDVYNELLRRADDDLSTAEGLAAIEELLDVTDLIDYMLIHQYTVNRDGPCCFESNNMRALRRRVDGETFRFFVWDMEYSLWDATDTTNVSVDVAGSISHVYTRLWSNADFRARYAARAREHLTGGGALTPDVAAARYAARADEIHAALLAESARWGDTYREVPYTRDVEWQAEYDRLMETYFPVRTAELIQQLEAVGLY